MVPVNGAATNMRISKYSDTSNSEVYPPKNRDIHIPTVLLNSSVTDIPLYFPYVLLYCQHCLNRPNG